MMDRCESFFEDALIGTSISEFNVDASVAIVLATYNGERFLREQLDSILAQTFEDWCIVASDDGSQDGTLEVLQDFIDAHPGKMIVLPHVGEGGACENFLDALNDAMESTNARYFAFCDQDDFWEPNKLEDSLRKLKELEGSGGDPALVFSDAAVANDGLEVIARSFFDYTGVDASRIELNQLLVQNPISGAGMLFNRSLAEIVSRSSYEGRIWMHDQWVGLIAACFGRIAAIKEPLFKYRQHDDNAMGAIEMSLKGIAGKARIAKSSLAKKQDQASFLLETYRDSLQEGQLHLLEEFVSLPSKSKIARIGCCAENAFFMNGALRNAGLLFFI